MTLLNCETATNHKEVYNVERTCKGWQTLERPALW